MKCHALKLSPAALIAACLASPGFAQANFAETFDAAGDVVGSQLGPSNLITRGWTFRRQSSPQGTGTWRTFGQGWSYEGAGCLSVDSSVTQVGGSGSGWAILPAVPGQQAGDPVTFWISQAYGTFSTPTGRLELRYSPTGSIGTGSTATDVGNFTQVLVTLPGLSAGQPWTRVQTVVPGTGRLALRVYQPASTSSSDYATNFMVDSLRVGTATGGVAFPAAGQTVHWTLAQSPVTLPQQHTEIVAGGTIIVDPGVRVNVASGYRLDVRGTLDVREGATFNIPATTFPASEVNVYGTASFTGTPASPVSIIGGARDWAATTERLGAMPGGKITASYVTLRSTFSAMNSGVVVADHITADGLYTGFFTSGLIYTTGGTIAVRDSVLSNGAWINMGGGYLLVDRCTFDNAQIWTQRYRGGHTVYLNNLVARNSPDSCFRLTGYDHFFGPGNTIAGNGFPVHLLGGGIAPGSTLPASGNTNNLIHGGIGTAVGACTFANAGLPYRIDRDDSMPDNMGGSIFVEPGVTVKMGPGAYIPASFGSELRLKGLPESPITFERLDPAQPWTTIWFAVSHVRPRVEHCVFRGADRGVDADESILRVDSCRFEGNHIGVNARNSGEGIIRKSRFFGNSVGAQSSYGSPASGFFHGWLDANGGPSNTPNWFEGNATGLETLNPLSDFDDARNCYWGDASGPTDPANPSGRGQATPGANYIMPFLATAPDTADTPPVVRLKKHSFLLEEGHKVILHWDASDDHAIAGFQIWYSAHGDNPGLQIFEADIPGTARSWEITVPEAPPASNYPDPSAFRVVAIDDAGQEGFDDMIFRTPWLHDVPERIAAGPMPALVRPGEPMTVCLAPGQAYFDAMMSLDGDGQTYSLGGTTTNCLSGTSAAPPISTDLARVIVWRGGAGGRDLYEFSNYFSVRPDSAIGDAPPSVTMTSPRAGESFAGGTGVPILWTASDDESLRSFEIHASYDDGRTWHTIADNLAGSDRGYFWRLPSSTGIAAVRVRVVARDLRFQTSSSGGDRTFAITPGAAPSCTGDFNRDGGVDGADVEAFFLAWQDSNPLADINQDGGIDGGDIETFFVAWQGGC